MQHGVTENEKKMTAAEWTAEGERRFGPDRMNWRFVCPSCGHIASTKDYKEAGAPIGAVGFSCIGRWKGDQAKNDANTFRGQGGPCTYAGGGLFGLNPVLVDLGDGQARPSFAFVDANMGMPQSGIILGLKVGEETII